MKNHLKLFLSLAVLLAIEISADATTYYSQKSLGKGANVTVLSNWNSQPTGTGTSPTNFTSGDEFRIINNDAMTASSAWTLSGTGAKLVIVNGTFDASGYNHTLTLDMQNTSSYTVTSTYTNLTLGSLASTSTFIVKYTTAASLTILRYLNYNSGLTLNLQATTSSTVNIAGSMTIGGDFTLNANAYLNRNFYVTSGITLNIAGNFIQNNSTFQGGSTAATSPNFIIGKDLIINNGLFIGSGVTTAQPSYTIAGNFIMNNGFFKGTAGNSSSIIPFTIAKNLTINGGKYQAKASSGVGIPSFILTGPNYSITHSAAATYTDINHSITIKGTINLASDVTVGNQLILSNGTLNLNAYNLQLNKDISYVGTGALNGTSASTLTLYSSTVITYNLKTVTVGTLNVSLYGTSQVTLTGTATVNTLLLNSGTLANPGSTLVIAPGGTINRSLGALTANPVYADTVNVIYSGTSAATMSFEVTGTGGTLTDLTISKTGGVAVNLSANIVLAGNLTINSGATFNPGGKTVTLNGNLVNNGILTSNLGKFVFNGTSTISGTPVSGGFSFYNVTISPAASLTAPSGANLLINGAFIASTGSIFNPNSGTVVFQATSGTQAIPGTIQYYNLSLINGATKSLPSTDTIFVSNTLSTSGGSVTMAGSSINFNGTAAQTIPALSYNNLTLSGSGTKTPLSSPLIVGDLSISGSAVLDGSNITILLSGDWTSGASAYTNTNGTVSFVNTSSSSINANGTTFYNITSAGSSATTFTSSATIAGVLTLTSGTVNTGGLLTVNLSTGAISGSGSGILNGNVTFMKNVPNVNSNFLSLPVAGATGNDLADDFQFINPTTNKSRLSIWDCATQKYLNNQSVNTTFTQGVGFQYFIAASGTIDVTGAYDHGSTGYTIPGCTSAANKFILVGNPYPSTMDWTSTGWTKTNLNDAVYFFNPTTSTFASYINGSGSNGGTQYIPSFQGFYVTTSGAGSPSLTMTNATRTTSTNPSLYRTASSDIFALSVSYKHYKDEAVVVLNEDASYYFESDKDALKLMNPDSAPSLYTKSLGTDYSINSIPSTNTDYVLPLGLNVVESGTYTFTANNSTSKEVYLEDKLTGKLTNLKDVPVFAVTVDSTQADRFQLRFSSSSAANNANNSTGTSLYYYDGMIYMSFDNTSNNSSISVYSVVGNTVLDNVAVNTGSGKAQISTASIKPGAYVVRVLQNGQVTTQTIIIQ